METSLEINPLLDMLIERGGADLHLYVGHKPAFRRNGSVEPLRDEILSEADVNELAKQITPPKLESVLQEEGSVDFAYAYTAHARFRVNLRKARGHNGLCMRLIPSRFLTFDQLGLHEQSMADMLKTPRGLTLVTGPTGSGKTTTLATMIDWINTHQALHIVTIEDPIEYTHAPKKSIITQREVRIDTPSFSRGVRDSLREDPDVILVGELRDLETMEAGLSAAETGHLVFGTMHTTGAAHTVDRIIDQFPGNQQNQIRTVLASTLRSVISQLLLRRKDGRGVVAAYEIMHNITAIASLIRQGKPYQITSQIDISTKQGMVTLDGSLFRLFSRDLIDAETCLRKANDMNSMRTKIGSHTGQEDEPLV